MHASFLPKPRLPGNQGGARPQEECGGLISLCPLHWENMRRGSRVSWAHATCTGLSCLNGEVMEAQTDGRTWRRAVDLQLLSAGPGVRPCPPGRAGSFPWRNRTLPGSSPEVFVPGAREWGTWTRGVGGGGAGDSRWWWWRGFLLPGHHITQVTPSGSWEPLKMECEPVKLVPHTWCRTSALPKPSIKG